jgi:phosphoribosylanthranilate isomerase
MSPARTRTKICGVTREADLRTAVDAGVDAVGVVADVTVETPREVPVGRARELLAAVPPFVTGTLVTMPDDIDAAVDLVERLAPDAVQVHGLGPAGTRRLRERVAVPVLAAVEAGEATRHAGAADALVVDSLDEQGGGGTGETGDWTRARGLVDSLDVPVVLAGGLTPENVGEAVRTVHPFAVDVASGVESSGGVKDAEAVRAFVRSAGGAQTGADGNGDEAGTDAEGVDA